MSLTGRIRTLREKLPALWVRLKDHDDGGRKWMSSFDGILHLEQRGTVGL